MEKMLGSKENIRSEISSFQNAYDLCFYQSMCSSNLPVTSNLNNAWNDIHKYWFRDGRSRYPSPVEWYIQVLKENIEDCKVGKRE